MKKHSFLFGGAFALSWMLFMNVPTLQAQSKQLNALKFKNTTQLKDFFKYKGDGSIIISGHRGGYEEGYSENCIEGFENVLTQMPAFFEIDPRLTKDSIPVLMHDPTLDRTTTGKGKVSDYTLKELRELRLKDHAGNVTDCRIPTLEEVIIWSKGKTIINLDKKDVPMEIVAALIKKHKADDHVMLTVHTGAQARFYYDRFPNIMMSAFARNMKEYEDLVISGVPWQNMIAYVGPTITPENRKICEMLRTRGVRCMISVAPTHDKLKTEKERAAKYKEEVNKRPDIIESDIPTEVWKVLQSGR
ncbi:glycerophosphodiester phosphodiesterase family protein [Bacteroides sp.]|uniref:glycerophosphodiester phosphodiesterase family protein n=1 Tax=Bacteroides sp. TaxID=29523 RepID=UPI0026338B59|nr:glycerophosphodiester phosphodiesterase family protein [Bacteroides sp.]MDD3038495.1 glycerophosphodiester phosphodiesterase family protein [Bacteroides sp.]